METIERAIQCAKEDHNQERKKAKKNEQVSSSNKHILSTNKPTDDSYSSWVLEISTSRRAYKKHMPRKFPAEGWKFFACPTRHTKRIAKRAMPLWSRQAEYLNSVGFVIASPQMHSFWKRNISFGQHCRVSSTPLRSGQAVFLTFHKQAMTMRRS
jgi:hypothetical protein